MKQSIIFMAYAITSTFLASYQLQSSSNNQENNSRVSADVFAKESDHSDTIEKASNVHFSNSKSDNVQLSKFIR